MLTIFKKIFGKGDKKKATPLLPTTAPAAPGLTQFESTIQSAKIEVARLSLAAIVAKLPEDIRALVLKTPEANVTVALPMQTILKQLPGGVVRMSLGSLHRQAPAGVFKPLPAGDKRMVEVPLSEVMKHVKPTAFKRRNDQRAVEAPPEDLALFNDRNKPSPAPAPAPKVEPIATPAPAPSAVAPPAIPSAPASTTMRVVAPPTDFKPAAPKSAPAAPKPDADAAADSAEAPLTLPIAKLSTHWPEPIRKEIAQLDPTTTAAMPHGVVKSGLARGMIGVTWGQILSGLTPKPASESTIDPGTELQLPLKIVAPAFLAQSKRPAAPRKTADVDETIPALFNKREAEATAPAAPTAPASEEAKAPEPPAATEAPAAEPPEAKSADAAPPTEEPGQEQEAPTASAPEEVSAEPEAPKPASLGAVFGEPDKERWTPAELVARVARLPGVAGAVVALQEGFQVAHALPEGINPETVSAFLPQIFGRLNQYSGEMKLGEVDDLLFTTRGAHCLIYRLGTLYFAVLGHPGATLPWQPLRLVAAELSRQNQK